MAIGDGALLSVRGEATQMVAPDVAVLMGTITATEESKEEAMAAAAAVQERLIEVLSKLGGVRLAVGTERSALTWSAFSTSTYPERQFDPGSRNAEFTGRVISTVRFRIAVRDLDRLQDLFSALAPFEAFYVNQVSWHVDEENPRWSAVRDEAIEAALRKAGDYAASLGVSLVRLEELADAGLLAGGTGTVAARGAAAALGRGLEAPSLDPVPQELRAVIEARFRTSAVTLPR